MHPGAVRRHHKALAPSDRRCKHLPMIPRTRNQTWRSNVRLCTLIGALGLCGVAKATGAGHATPRASSSASPSPDVSEVAALVGSARCRADSDCATIALPDQACGGPSGWLAFSVGGTDRQALQRALRRAAASQAATAGQAVSTCAVIPDPGAICAAAAAAPNSDARRCLLRAPQGAQPSLPLR